MSLTNGHRSGVVLECLRCHHRKRHEGRGLCKCCYNHLWEGRCRNGESLDDYPVLGGYGTAAAVLAGEPCRAQRWDPAHLPMRTVHR